MNIRFHGAALFVLTFFLLPSFAFERVEFVPFGPYELEPLNPTHFDEAVSWAPEAFADFNGDKLPDLLSASNKDGTVELFYRIRDGGFKPGQLVVQYNANGDAPNSLAVGDWNLDGHNDFAVSLGQSETLIALNQGDGAFTMRRGAYRGLLASSDVDGDGHPDLITLGGGFLMWRLSAPGDWDAVEWRQQTAEQNLLSIQLADFDGDGILDLGAFSLSSKHWTYFGDGLGGFSEAVATPNGPISASSNNYVNTADFNGDGLADLLGFSIKDYNQRTMDFFFRNADGSFQDAVAFDLPWVSYNDQYAISDFNIDGYDDVAAFIRNEAGVSSRIRVMYGPYQDGFQWIDDIYVSDAEPLGLYAINTLASGAADLMAIFHDPSEAVYFRWTDLEDPHRFRLPKTLRVPEDALTLSQAVREYIESDEISIASGTYADPIQIEGGTFFISGRENAALPLITGDWTVRNSDCTIGLIQTNESTITVEQSNLDLFKSKLRGVSSERSFPYGLWLQQPSRPALIVHDSSGALCRLTNCDLTGGDVIEAASESEKESVAGAAMLIESCANSLFQVANTKIQGGAGETIPSSRYNVSLRGGAALAALDSIGVQIISDESSLQGGSGTPVLGYSTGSKYETYIGPEGGGPGLKAVRSSVVFRRGRIDGGLGGDGGVFRTNIFDETDPTAQSFDGAMGGAGAQAFESSRIVIEDSILNGGPGGEPNGEYGPRIEVDATSQIELINTTRVQNWFLY